MFFLVDGMIGMDGERVVVCAGGWVMLGDDIILEGCKE